MVNFMMLDLSAIALGFLLWAALGICQGYLVGYFTNVLSFRAKSFGNRLKLSMMLAVSVLSVFTHLGSAAFGLSAMSMIFLSTVPIFLFVVFRDSKKLRFLLQKERHFKTPYLAVAAGLVLWSILELLMICDLQVGSKLFYPTTAVDYLKHISIADGICRSGVPPVNPLFSPGVGQPLFYYYFWHLTAAIISRLMGSAMDARAAVLSGAVWTSLVLVAATAYSARYFRFVKQHGKSLTATAVLLLLVGNLYVIFALPVGLLALSADVPMTPTIINGTDDIIAPFTISTFWVPHHVAAFVAMLTCIMIMLNASAITDRRKWLMHVFLAGCCAASTVGQSIYLACALAATFAVWFVVCAIKKSKRAMVAMICIGAIGLCLATPFLRELMHGGHHRQWPVQFAFRYLDPLQWVLGKQHGIHVWILDFLYYPWSFLYGMGFVLAASFSYWKIRFRQKLSDREQILIGMFFVCIFLCTFFRSTIAANDFGWRVTIPPLFACLIWSANYIAMIGKPEFPRAKMTFFLKSLILIGLCNLAADAWLMRVASCKLGGESMYDARSVYYQLEKLTKPNALVQHNPTGMMIVGMYSHRQVAASDDRNGYCFGPTKEEYIAVADEIETIFKPGLTPEQLGKICDKYHIDVIVIRDKDPIWRDADSPVWKYPVVAERPLAKAVLVNRTALLQSKL